MTLNENEIGKIICAFSGKIPRVELYHTTHEGKSVTTLKVTTTTTDQQQQPPPQQLQSVIPSRSFGLAFQFRKADENTSKNYFVPVDLAEAEVLIEFFRNCLSKMFGF